jgi:hypothetical protein
MHRHDIAVAADGHVVWLLDSVSVVEEDESPSGSALS